MFFYYQDLNLHPGYLRVHSVFNLKSLYQRPNRRSIVLVWKFMIHSTLLSRITVLTDRIFVLHCDGVFSPQTLLPMTMHS